MNCVICRVKVRDGEGFVSNVNYQGKEPTDADMPIVVCGDACKAAFEKSLPMNGRPIVHLSRITGYYQVVENWNAGKQQEFLDRHRYEVV